MKLPLHSTSPPKIATPTTPPVTPQPTHPAIPRAVGAGVALEQIDTVRAVAACQAAVEATTPPRPRYAFLFGRALMAQKTYDFARRMFIASDQGGSAMGAFALGYMYVSGLGGDQNLNEALRLYARAGDAGVADGYANGGQIYLNANPPNTAEPCVGSNVPPRWALRAPIFIWAGCIAKASACRAIRISPRNI